jgi:quercetin dioxygenase-like cupin family protein
MTAEMTAAIIGRGEGMITRGQAGEIAFKIRAADSGGAYSTWEYLVQPGGVSSPHYHLKIYESWYVLEGRLEVRLDDRWSTAPAGSMVLIPVGVVHAFRNETAEPARLLLTAAPGGVELYFGDLDELMRNSPGGTPDVEQLRKLNRKHDFVLVED